MLYFSGYNLIMPFPGKMFFTYNWKAQQEETRLAPKHVSHPSTQMLNQALQLRRPTQGEKIGTDKNLRAQEVTSDVGLNSTASQLINSTEQTCSQELYAAH